MVKVFISVARIVLAALVAVIFGSCRVDVKGISGSGNVTTQNRSIQEEFQSISAEGGLEIIIEQSNEKAVMVEADDNVQKHILTTVKNGVLNISTDKNQFINVSSKKVFVKMPVLRSIEASAGVVVKSANLINTEKLMLDASGGSMITIEVEADKIISETSSGSQNRLKGKTLDLNISASSGSTNDADKLMANDVYADASSGSSISVHPIVNLDAEASSGASVVYYNMPQNLRRDESSGGSVSGK